MAHESYELIIVVLGFLLAGNGILMYFIRRKDKVSTLAKMNNRQAAQITMLTTAIMAVLESQESLVDALQDTGILNGNSAKITNYLKTAKSTISEYAKKVCRDQIVLEKE